MPASCAPKTHRCYADSINLRIITVKRLTHHCLCWHLLKSNAVYVLGNKAHRLEPQQQLWPWANVTLPCREPHGPLKWLSTRCQIKEPAREIWICNGFNEGEWLCSAAFIFKLQTFVMNPIHPSKRSGKTAPDESTLRETVSVALIDTVKFLALSISYNFHVIRNLTLVCNIKVICRRFF